MDVTKKQIEELCKVFNNEIIDTDNDTALPSGRAAKNMTKEALQELLVDCANALLEPEEDRKLFTDDQWKQMEAIGVNTEDEEDEEEIGDEVDEEANEPEDIDEEETEDETVDSEPEVIEEKTKKKSKSKSSKKISKNKNDFGHSIGSQADAMDQALLNNMLTIKQISEATGLKSGRINSHIKHLKEKGYLKSKDDKFGL